MRSATCAAPKARSCTLNVMWMDRHARLELLLPSQAELGWTRSAGSDRIGVTLGYGI
ncbi:MAG: hypothetical protein AB7P03_04845 [Kofleriaceae bacterium]